MNVILQKVPVEKKCTLNNLLEKYMYEFSQYDMNLFDNNALFNYKYLNSYWIDKERIPYFIMVDNNLAGFVMINKNAECDRPIDWSIAEFFISYAYRRLGIGTIIMQEIFEMYKGWWHIKYHPDNLASKLFWTNIVTKSTNCNYELLDGTPNSYKTCSKILVFSI